MIHTINNLPLEYELQVKQTEGNINQDDNPLTLEQVCSTTRLKFERLNVYNEDDTYEKEINKDLVKIQLKGICNYCGKYGHKKQDCRGNGKNDKIKDNTGNKGRLNGTCNHCNNFGHKQSDFYKKQSNEQGNYNGTWN